MKRTVLILTTLLLAASAIADDGKPPSTGLSVFANAGGFWADKVTADFYSGRPENANTIYRVLHSNSYGMQIWNNLTTQGLISSAVGSYDQLQVVEWPDMYYRTSYQIGLGMRYDYRSGFGWLLRFDLARLTAIGAFNISSDGGVGILGDDPYIRCGMMGSESRINIDVALTRIVALGDALSLELNLGGSLVNTKVRENLMEIGGATYSILDVWNGQTPDVGVGSYEYMNQGGVGVGVFVSAFVGYGVEGFGAIKAGYTCYHSNTVLEGYSAWGWQHMLGIRVEINNYSFFEN